MILEQEQTMANLPAYSPLFSCIYDQPEPVGSIGRGSHYSVFRTVQWRDIDGDFRDSGREHDIAVVWDEDHDSRIVDVIGHFHMAGLLWPVVFIGERKGLLTLILWHGVDPSVERADWYDAVREIAANETDHDSWSVEYGTFHRDPANTQGLTEPSGLIADDRSRVVAYLQAIDVVWQVGEKHIAKSRNR
jgi:hypothetical protein